MGWQCRQQAMVWREGMMEEICRGGYVEPEWLHVCLSEILIHCKNNLLGLQPMSWMWIYTLCMCLCTCSLFLHRDGWATCADINIQHLLTNRWMNGKPYEMHMTSHCMLLCLKWLNWQWSWCYNWKITVIFHTDDNKSLTSWRRFLFQIWIFLVRSPVIYHLFWFAFFFFFYQKNSTCVYHTLIISQSLVAQYWHDHQWGQTIIYSGALPLTGTGCVSYVFV